MYSTSYFWRVGHGRVAARFFAALLLLYIRRVLFCCVIKTNINGGGITGFGSQRWGRELSHAVKMIDNVIILNGSNV